MASLAAINNLGDYAHNPRGNIWFNDESSYGHKMLLKMGWNKGKGLGKNENGIKENVKVKFRNTNSGLGFKNDAYNNIMNTGYESILKNLHAEYSHNKNSSIQKKGTDKKEKKCDQQSKVVKSKLRYPKLFFGKDVTKYSEKDMKSIFICSLPAKDHEEKEDDMIISQKEKSEIEPPKMYKTNSNGLSISDYFNKKMKEKKNNMLNKELSNFPDQHHISIESVILKSDNLTSNKNESRKRKKKHVEANINEEFNNAVGSHQNVSECPSSKTENLGFSSDKKSSKKKKRKYEMTVNKEDCVDNNEPKSHNIMKQDLLEVPVSESNIFENNKIANEEFCRPSKKRKTKHIFENGNSSLNSCKLFSESTNSEAESSSIFIKEKKKKSSNVDILSLENHVSDNEIEIFEMLDDHSSESEKNSLSNNIDHSKKNKKLMKKLKQRLKSCLKKKSGSYSLKRVSFNESVSCRAIGSEFESVECLAKEESSFGVDISCEIINIDDSNSTDDALCETVNIDGSNTTEDALCQTVNIDDCNSSEDVLCETVNVKDSNSSDVTCTVKNECSDEKSVSCNSSTEEQKNTSGEKVDEEYMLSCLPSSKSSHYNSWIESQRQAIKMELYKNMLKSIKKHKILKKSNLFDIKGYGNWGF